MRNNIPFVSFFLLMVFLFLIPSNVHSQESKKYKLKWGKVSKEDLEMKSYSEDPDAAAVVLGEIGTIDFDISGEDPKVILTKHVRIKILSESGLDWGDVSIPFFHKNEKIESVKGQSIQPDGTVSKLSKKNIYNNKVNDYWSEVKFAIPNVQVGSVIEYKFREEMENVFQLPFWYFQGSIPKKWSRLSMSIPRWFHYLPIQEYTSGIIKNKVQKETIVTVAKYVRKKVGTGYTQRIWEGSRDVNMIVKYYDYTMEKVPEFEEDPLVANSLDYCAKIYFQLNAVEFRDNIIEPISESWKKYIANRIEHQFFGKQYLNQRNHKKIIEAISPLIANAKTDDEKISIISKFILNHVKWDGYYGIYVDKSLNDAFANKSASSGEMNLMGIALLNHFEIKSYPVLVSTRKNGKVIKSYPIVNQFNHVVIYTDKEKKLLDFSGLSLKNGLVRPEALSSEGLVIMDKEDYGWVELSAPYSQKTMITKTTLDEKGELKGEMTIVNDNYTAFINRVGYRDKKNDETYAKRFFKKDLGTAQIEGIEVKNEKEVTKKFISQINFTIPKFADSSKDLIYMPVMLDEGWSWMEKSLKKEIRNYPLDFPYPFKDKYILNIVIPKGYTVEEVPENAKVVTPDGNFDFSYLSSLKDNNLQIIISFSSKKYHYSIEESARIKELFSLVSNKVNELVVLKKQ